MFGSTPGSQSATTRLGRRRPHTRPARSPAPPSRPSGYSFSFGGTPFRVVTARKPRRRSPEASTGHYLGRRASYRPPWPGATGAAERPESAGTEIRATPSALRHASRGSREPTAASARSWANSRAIATDTDRRSVDLRVPSNPPSSANSARPCPALPACQGNPPPVVVRLAEKFRDANETGGDPPQLTGRNAETHVGPAWPCVARNGRARGG